MTTMSQILPCSLRTKVYWAADYSRNKIFPLACSRSFQFSPRLFLFAKRDFRVLSKTSPVTTPPPPKEVDNLLKSLTEKTITSLTAILTVLKAIVVVAGLATTFKDIYSIYKEFMELHQTQLVTNMQFDSRVLVWASVMATISSFYEKPLTFRQPMIVFLSSLASGLLVKYCPDKYVLAMVLIGFILGSPFLWKFVNFIGVRLLKRVRKSREDVVNPGHDNNSA